MVKLKRALRSAMIYPGVILSVAVVVVGVILWKVVPVFRTLFEGFRVQLPMPHPAWLSHPPNSWQTSDFNRGRHRPGRLRPAQLLQNGKGAVCH